MQKLHSIYLVTLILQFQVKLMVAHVHVSPDLAV